MSTLEGVLGKPAVYLLPDYSKNRRRRTEHPLHEMARRSLEAAGPINLADLAEVMVSDTDRLFRDPGYLRGADDLLHSIPWGLSKNLLPKVLVIAEKQKSLSQSEKFAGVLMDKSPVCLDVLTRLSGIVVNQKVMNAFGTAVEANISGVIMTDFLDLNPSISAEDTPSDWEILKKYLNPNQATEPIQPELFTWRRAFNSAKDLYPAVNGADQIKQLTPEQQFDFANKLLGYGLETLAAESKNKFIRLASSRLIKMCATGGVNLHLTNDPYAALEQMTGKNNDETKRILPEKHGLVYLPGEKRGSGAILVPFQWMEAAINRDIIALTHLTRIASQARDHHFGKLDGTVMNFSKELGIGGEIEQSGISVTRADKLASLFFNEALGYDSRIYGIQVNRDEYCRRIERMVTPVRNYEDPPEPKGRGGNDGPNNGPDGTLIPSRPRGYLWLTQ